MNTGNYVLCYIAGPMSGYTNFNRQAFREVERLLHSEHRIDGLDIDEYKIPVAVNPVNVDEAAGITDVVNEDNVEEWKAHFAALNEVTMRPCKRIILLPGWNKSGGAIHELSIANRFNIPAYTYNCEDQSFSRISFREAAQTMYRNDE